MFNDLRLGSHWSSMAPDNTRQGRIRVGDPKDFPRFGSAFVPKSRRRRIRHRVYHLRFIFLRGAAEYELAPRAHPSPARLPPRRQLRAFFYRSAFLIAIAPPGGIDAAPFFAGSCLIQTRSPAGRRPTFILRGSRRGLPRNRSAPRRWSAGPWLSPPRQSLRAPSRRRGPRC